MSVESEHNCPRCRRPLSGAGEPCGHCTLIDVDDDATIVDRNTRTLVDGDAAQAAEFTGPKRIAGYRILRELGAGGMGTVFEAHDEKMDRRVALKVLSRSLAPSEKAGLRFEQEAWIAGKLDHPNLVKVYERGSWEDLSYYAMELVDGGSLGDVIKNLKRWGRDDRWNLEFGSREYTHWAISQVITAARALGYAHRHGVVHRDIKPMNLLLSREPLAVKIADFGLAIDEEATRMTTAGNVLGTLMFMAPEQILGKSDKIGAAADIYALGVTLFELLTLSLPFKGATQQMYMNAVLTTEARLPSKLNEQVSRELEIVICKALEKEPRDRYATADALADDLENVVHLRPINAQPVGRIPRTWKWARRKPVHAALLAVLILGTPTLVGLGYVAMQRQQIVKQGKIEDLWREVSRYSREARYEQAVDVSSRLLDLDPKHVGALRARALSRFQLGLDEEVFDDIKRIERIEDGKAWPHAMSAHLLRRLGRDDEAASAEALADRFRSANKSEEELQIDAWDASDREEYDRAIDYLSQVVARRPGRPEPLVELARVQDLSGDAEEAIQNYRLALAIRPDEDSYRIDLGRLYTSIERYEDSERFLREALDRDPDDAHALEVLSDTLLQQSRVADSANAADGFLERAEQAARRSVELRREAGNAASPWSHINIGQILIERHRLQPDPARAAEAIEQYELAIATWTEPPTGRDAEPYMAAIVNSCEALIEVLDLDRALAACTRTTERFPDLDIGFYNLAGVHALRGDADRAFAALDRDYELGDRDWEYLQDDAWFERLRRDPRFSKLIARMKRGQV